MEVLSVLLNLNEGKPPVTAEFLSYKTRNLVPVRFRYFWPDQNKNEKTLLAVVSYKTEQYKHQMNVAGSWC